MTPPERAAYLIKECGTIESAISHANWVHDDVKKQITKDYWKAVIDELHKTNNNAQV